jgi:microcin C transport system substrate-binding protein
MNRFAAATAALIFIATLAPGAAPAAETWKGHGLAMHGDLKYPPGFRNFDYVNPAAPKGGEVRLATIGGYDSGTGRPFMGRLHAAAAGQMA